MMRCSSSRSFLDTAPRPRSTQTSPDPLLARLIPAPHLHLHGNRRAATAAGGGRDGTRLPLPSRPPPSPPPFFSSDLPHSLSSLEVGDAGAVYPPPDAGAVSPPPDLAKEKASDRSPPGSLRRSRPRPAGLRLRRPPEGGGRHRRTARGRRTPPLHWLGQDDAAAAHFGPGRLRLRNPSGYRRLRTEFVSTCLTFSSCSFSDYSSTYGIPVSALHK